MSAGPVPVKVTWRSALLATDAERERLGLPPGPPPGARLIGAALAENVNMDGFVWVGAETLAERTGYTERAVRQNMAKLSETGWLEKMSQGGVKGGPRTSHWKVTTPELCSTTPEL